MGFDARLTRGSAAFPKRRTSEPGEAPSTRAGSLTMSSESTLGPKPVLGFLMVHMALRADVAALVDEVETAAEAAPRAPRRTPRTRRLRPSHRRGPRAAARRWPARVGGFDPVTALLAGTARGARRRRSPSCGRSAESRAGRAAPTLRGGRPRRPGHARPSTSPPKSAKCCRCGSASFTDADHEAFGRRLRRATPVRDVSVMVPWLLDRAPESVKAEAWREVPLPVRAAYKLWWRRAFGRRYGGGVALAA